MKRTWRIGESMPRVEDRSLLRGETEFLSDRRSRTEAVMLVARSSIASGLVTQIDKRAALAVPDVLMVLTSEDLISNGPLPCVDTNPSSVPAFQPVLADREILYAGQPVAAVVAATLHAAREGVAALSLETEANVPVMSMSEGREAHVVQHIVGNPRQHFANADLVLEGDFAFHRLSACPLEPRVVEACLDEASGCLVVRATTQIAVAAQGHLARLLNLPPEYVRYEPMRLGGGFGLKEAFYPEEVLVGAAALRLGWRVRWEETRNEHFVASSHGREGRAHVRMAVAKDGIITALEVDGQSDIGGAYGYVGNSPGAMMGAMIRGPYRIPHFASRTASILTNKTPLNVYRGAGHPQAVFAMERMIEKVARALNIDRMDIRRRNFIPNDAFPHVRHTPDPGCGRTIVYDSGNYEKCLDEALDAIGAIGFDERRREHEAEHPDEKLGLGMAFMVELTATAPDETIAMEVGADGHITIFAAPVSMGQGAESALTQVLSSALEIDIEDITVRCGDNKGYPTGGGAYGSRGAAICGSAVSAGAENLKLAAIAIAAEVFGVAADGLGWAEGGVVGLSQRNIPVGLEELLNHAPSDALSRLAVTGTCVVPASATSSAAHAAIVSVEIDTGVVRILDYAIAHDCGVILNPKGVDGQMRGGVMQGIGAVLFEDLSYAPDGTLLIRGLLDYPIPVAATAPRFHLRHVETPSPLNPLGLKGAGEGGFTGAPAAIVNALEDALREIGIELDDDGPYPPSRVLQIIKDGSSARLSASGKGHPRNV